MIELSSSVVLSVRFSAAKWGDEIDRSKFVGMKMKGELPSSED